MGGRNGWMMRDTMRREIREKEYIWRDLLTHSLIKRIVIHYSSTFIILVSFIILVVFIILVAFIVHTAFIIHGRDR